jgi:hypothetical protein
MENNSGLQQFILINLDEHQARIYDTRPGWNLLDCTGDIRLKQRYLKEELSKEDIEAWREGVVTEHCRELLMDIGASDTDVRIEYRRENRQYEIEVVE